MKNMEKNFKISNTRRPYFIALRSLQILTVIYFTSSSLICHCEIQGNNNIKNNKIENETTALIPVPPKYLDKETWNGHKKSLQRRYCSPKSCYSPQVVIYFDLKLITVINDSKANRAKSANWIFQFTSHVWDYMTKTYGRFHSDSSLYLVVHYMDINYSGVYLEYSADSQNQNQNNRSHFRNLLDVASLKPNAWMTNETREEDKNLIVDNLAYFVEKSYKGHFGSPSYNVWKRESYGHTAWVDIFTYDVYKGLNLTNEAESYEKKVNIQFETSLANRIFWFRDWFLPIYNNQTGNSGGSSSSSGVLRNYFQLIYDYVPKDTNNVYTHHFNLAEFVHFWSGAANVSLKQLAQKVFGGDSIPEVEFMNARLNFSEVSKFYVYNENEATTKQTTKPPPTTTQLIPTHGHLNNTTTTISGATSKNGSASGTTESTEKENANKNTDNASENNNSSDGSLVIIVASVAGSIIILLIIVIGTTYIVQKKKIIYLKVDIRMLTNDEVDDFFEGNKDTNISSDEAQALILSMPFITAFEIPKDQMVLDYTKVLGSGQFGSVVQGQIRSRENDEMISVAMKTVKPNVDVDSFKAFLSEVKIMAYLGKHENIVELLGTCTAHIKNREIYIALEFCHLGSLESYLKKNRDKFEITGTAKSSIGSAPGLPAPADSIENNATSALSSLNGNKIDTLDLLKWSREVSNAMIYLTEKKVIHGDLAARNVLLTEQRVAKISDFGLSRQFLNYANYMKTSKVPVPWRWLAVESLKEMKFSTASDVWAFGVTIWEIFSLSEIPYGAWTYDLFFADRLIAGDRLGVPKHGNEQIYKLMKNCWKVDPTERPSFQNIYTILDEHISNYSNFPLINNANQEKDENTRRSLSVIEMEAISETTA